MYELTDRNLTAFDKEPLSSTCTIREGIHTGDNTVYVRSWWEVNNFKIYNMAESEGDVDNKHCKWVPYNKGGTTRSWFYDTEFVLAFNRDSRDKMAKLSGHVRPSQGLYFKEGATWSDVGTKGFGLRYFPKGYLFADAGPVVNSSDIFNELGVMNSAPFKEMAMISMPNLHYKSGTMNKLPKVELSDNSKLLAKDMVDLHREFTMYDELQRHFIKPSLMREKNTEITSSSIMWSKICDKKYLDIHNNQAVLNNEVQEKLNWIYVTDDPLSLANHWAWSREVEIECLKLVSYALGCMMGRYSLDREGLVYAHAGNEGFSKLVEEGAYQTFLADDDGIIPMLDEPWFGDDATNRFRDFVKTVWGEDNLQENLDFVAQSLCLYGIKPKKTEGALETIRRYLSTQFYKDHLRTYKKRPIYWLFSSGKQKAFECLVYLHRYNEGTLARMRTEYVTPLLGKYDATLQQLSEQIDRASSTAEANKLKKQQTALEKKLTELRAFDDNLKHHADMRIPLDLDDGVKVNYGKFGNLLHDVKAITGKKPA